MQPKNTVDTQMILLSIDTNVSAVCYAYTSFKLQIVVHLNHLKYPF